MPRITECRNNEKTVNNVQCVIPLVLSTNRRPAGSSLVLSRSKSVRECLIQNDMYQHMHSRNITHGIQNITWAFSTSLYTRKTNWGKLEHDIVAWSGNGWAKRIRDNSSCKYHYYVVLNGITSSSRSVWMGLMKLNGYRQPSATQNILLVRGIHRFLKNVLFRVLMVNFSRKPALLHEHMFIALDTRPAQ